MLVEVQTGQRSAVPNTLHATNTDDPVWSPDGEWIAFRRTGSAGESVLATTLDGLTLKVLINDLKATSGLTWSAVPAVSP